MVSPLSSVTGVEHVLFAPGSIAKRPELAAGITQVIETWSWCDARMLYIGRQCLGGNALVSTAALQAVKNQDAQKAMVFAAVRASVDVDHAAVFEAAVNSTNRSRTVRHQFAHHYWGISDDLPNALILLDPRDLHVEIATRLQLQIRKHAGQEDRTRMFVWRQQDVDEAAASAKRAHEIMSLCEGMIHRLTRGLEVVAIRRRLLEDSEIERRYQGQSRTAPP